MLDVKLRPHLAFNKHKYKTIGIRTIPFQQILLDIFFEEKMYILQIFKIMLNHLSKR